MKKKKNKKLKKQFRELLQNQLANNLKEAKIETHEEKTLTLEEKAPEKIMGNTSYVKKDLKRTLIITAFVLFLMIFLYFYLNLTHSASNMAKSLLKIIGS